MELSIAQSWAGHITAASLAPAPIPADPLRFYFAALLRPAQLKRQEGAGVT
jgi:hypothetical protein